MRGVFHSGRNAGRQGQSERCERVQRRLATHQSAAGQSGARRSADTARRLEGATYTLCVITGTHELGTALFVARQQMAQSMR
ncbi:hypothetical protein ACM01_20400 [Streptomyces viridochromogenes]|uniref:DUF5133 domain-containing protein n=1 Tax=Streptomyces viridochromogenes TaxID=1938 RepID=A0A0J8C5K2_STRVR|nr:DUF5133 domain-containing protein [Streptomyces viridochromogenes]KMS73120.1 hypothetical protein ACM01_20400 [Streptomyces viridochromogenes]